MKGHSKKSSNMNLAHFQRIPQTGKLVGVCSSRGVEYAGLPMYYIYIYNNLLPQRRKTTQFWVLDVKDVWDSEVFW